jgi:ADP-heptose:LPS heptosyltransferase
MKERGNRYLRFLDRYGGIPLIALLGCIKSKKIPPAKIEKIALLKTAGIGDTVLLIGIIQDLKKNHPHAKITLFTGTSNHAMGKLIADIFVIALPMTHPFKALKLIRKQHFDLWIDCDPWPRINACFSFFSRSLWSIGFKTEGQGRHWVYDSCVIHRRDCHEIQNYRNLLNSLGMKTGSLPNIPIPPTYSKQRRVALHLCPGGSRAHLKMWPERNWVEMMRKFSEASYEVVLTGGMQDRKYLTSLIDENRLQVKCEAGNLSLFKTSELLLTCICLISVDTGIMHLAAALGCPVISLHGPTSPQRWGAIGETIVSITPRYPYAPCIHLGFESQCRKNFCMQAITVDQVLEAFYCLEKENII